ncbi:MAG: 2-amino-4-hydroxy-6-hydroxymethyldihydropteridine diphosphokinase [Betaproteobacteria bacterium HGW-Betaproteobacteria-22]|nr:MAG: 2-amino-4-hydroxy-6-hydroxymethyldihydropteridine diphosphokinase [Betaproteobacteria bacterium HGW-Betaproteobacteria-22]
MHLAYIALGSNLAEPVTQVKNALVALSQLPNTQVLKQSSLYQTTPVDCPQKSAHAVPDFINAVALLETELAPYALLTALHTMENNAGRERPYVNAPRVLDCDLLLYGNEMINTTTLTIPHPRIHLRGFVLLPLFEIAPQLILPKHGKIAQLITPALSQGVSKLTS